MDKLSERYAVFVAKFEKYVPLLSVIFFALGVVIARVSSAFAHGADKGMSYFVDSYGYFAPIAIYLILTPSLIKILTSCGSNGKKFIRYMIGWFAATRLVACLWGVIFTTIVFGLPLFVNHTTTFGGAFIRALRSLGWMVTHSTYFYAIYASLITVYISLKVEKIARLFRGCSNIIERLGEYFIPIVPVFMLAIGSYVSYLPVSIKQQIHGGTAAHLNSFTILGFSIEANTSLSMIVIYLVGAFLTGIACFIWHFGLMLLAKFKTRDFSIRAYFKNYWSKVYPLLWATSSESLATPLNLHLVKKYYPYISDEIRGFAIGGGSFLGINGTIICVFVLAGLIAEMLGIQISFLQLFFSIPLVFLIGYGVPGIPGELLLFGGPMVIILGVDPAIASVFLTLYVGLQIGLPDSFRTGANSTDNCVNGIILQATYDRKYKVHQDSVTLVGESYPQPGHIYKKRFPEGIQIKEIKDPDKMKKLHKALRHLVGEIWPR